MFNFFKGNKIIVVVKRESAQKAKDNALMLIEQGIKNIEITFNTPNAVTVIKDLKKLKLDILVGAGTVMNADQAKQACLAQADFIVSPGFISEVSDVCHQFKVLYVPGVLTPTEICQAINSGWNFIKLFPSSFVGIDYIKSLKSGPFPNLEFMPTAGVNKNNIKAWFASGASAVGMSGKLLSDDQKVISQELTEIIGEL